MLSISIGQANKLAAASGGDSSTSKTPNLPTYSAYAQKKSTPTSTNTIAPPTTATTPTNFVPNYLNYNQSKGQTITPMKATNTTTTTTGKPTTSPINSNSSNMSTALSLQQQHQQQLLNEQHYATSLERFVKKMDKRASESVTKFIKNLKRPVGKESLPTVITPPQPLPISSELHSQLKALTDISDNSSSSTTTTNNNTNTNKNTNSSSSNSSNSSTTVSKTQTVNAKVLEELTALSNEGFDLSFLQQLDPTINVNKEQS